VQTIDTTELSIDQVVERIASWVRAERLTRVRTKLEVGSGSGVCLPATLSTRQKSLRKQTESRAASGWSVPSSEMRPASETRHISRHVVGSAYRARLGIAVRGAPRVAEPIVAIGGYFSWRSLRMRSLRALMAANSRCAHIVAAMPHPKPITNIVI